MFTLAVLRVNYAHRINYIYLLTQYLTMISNILKANAILWLLAKITYILII